MVFQGERRPTRHGSPNTASGTWSIEKLLSRQRAAADCVCRRQPCTTRKAFRGKGNLCENAHLGRKRKEVNSTILNSYCGINIEFSASQLDDTRLELVDKDELFLNAATHPLTALASGNTFGGVCDLVQIISGNWPGADVTFHSKPPVLDPIYGSGPVSFDVFLRMRPGLIMRVLKNPLSCRFHVFFAPRRRSIQLG